MNDNEIKELIKDNLKVGIYQNTNYTEDKLEIKVVLMWEDEKISEDYIHLKLNSNNSLSYDY